MKGVLKWYNRVKGYGFLVADDGGPDLFFHHTGITMDKKEVASLCEKEGAAVEFDEVEGKNGRKAVNVRVVPLTNP